MRGSAGSVWSLICGQGLCRGYSLLLEAGCLSVESDSVAATQSSFSCPDRSHSAVCSAVVFVEGLHRISRAILECCHISSPSLVQ